jgi:hypothetical protein
LLLLAHQGVANQSKWLANWNGQPTPFVWKASADVILDKVRRRWPIGRRLATLATRPTVKMRMLWSTDPRCRQGCLDHLKPILRQSHCYPDFLEQNRH